MSAPQRLVDLPYAEALEPFEGELGAAGRTEYDSFHFHGTVLADAAAGGSRFMDCAFEGVTFQGGRLHGSRFSDVWLRESRMISTDLARTQWTDAAFVAVGLAGVQAFDAQLRRVVFERCKFDSINLRGASLTEVVFDGCLLRDADFGGAKLARVSFPGSRLVDADFAGSRLDLVDLRGAELGIAAGHGALSGAIIDSAQLVDLAPAFAQALGVTVSDR
jgi:uncharacterized protein YjbI with pentapeptide repeats